jgi:hypothetical protein
MAEEKIGSPISKQVVEQIEARKKIVGKKTGRTSEDLLYLNSKTAWVRLSSGVNTITDEEAQQYAAQEGRGTIKGSNVLAGTNILQGGLLDPNRGLREGISYIYIRIINKQLIIIEQRVQVSDLCQVLPGLLSLLKIHTVPLEKQK